MRWRDRTGGKVKARRHKALTLKVMRRRSSSRAGRETNVARLSRELSQAFEQQAATAEILHVISNSPTDTQPVFNAIVQSGLKLFPGALVSVALRYGDTINAAAVAAPDPARVEAWRLTISRTPLARNYMHGAALLDRRIVDIPDVADAPAEFLAGSQNFLTSGNRAITIMPMMRGDEAIGLLSVVRFVAGPLSDTQRAVLRTFANQAVIAIENTRLLKETKEALERQTATAEILRVISSSPTDVQPVFDAIVDSCTRLLAGSHSTLRLIKGDRAEIVASNSTQETNTDKSPMPLDDDSLPTTQAVLRQEVVQIPDTFADGVSARIRQRGEQRGFRSLMIAPMLRESSAMGTIHVHRATPGRFTEKEVALLETFASQAVIAIENVRLFKELQAQTTALTRSVGQLTALGEVGQAISSTLDLETVLKTIVSHAIQLTGLDGGAIYEYDEHSEEFRLQMSENAAEDVMQVAREEPIRLGDGAVGRAGVTREPVQVPDTLDESYQSERRELLIRSGYRAVLAVPLLRESHLLGALLVTRKTPGPFGAESVQVLKTFAAQSALAIQNARLFREVAEKGKQLEEASQHKSQFLASMSHELRTPLNAILGFNEMILDEIYGPVTPDVRSPLEEMQASGKHLLRLINNVLDLAKIEAGRMELSLYEYSVHDTVESVRSTLRSIAAEKGLELLTVVPADIPLAYGDPGRIAQCLLNLAGNALKFTKAGKVEIGAKLEGDQLVYRVADTGVGIPVEKIGSLFTEFKQIDATIASEYGGTGLGLSITKKFIEMHGGRIWIESELGKGSAFIFEVPLRAKAT
jgi:two-component system, NtrC family, sensor kinase